MTVQPIYHWTFEQAEGSIIKDEINGAPAKMNTCTLELHGRIGKAIHLTAKGSSLDLGLDAGQLGTGDFTIAFGMAVLARRSDDNLDIIGTRSSKSHGNWVSLLLLNKHRLSFEVDEDKNGKNYFTIATDAIIDDHSWHHVALVREGPTLRIYVEGVLQAEDKLPAGVGIANIHSNDSPMKLGDWLRDTPDALYEDLRIYNTALSTLEIQCLVTPPNRFLSPGQIELVAVDNAAIILSQDEADLTRYSSVFQTIRLGADTGATLYSGSNFEGISQKLYADVPEIDSTKLNAFPKSVLVWPATGTPFTGKWIISAGNRQYLHQNKDMLEISSQHLSGGFFSFYYNPFTQQTLLISANNAEIALLKVGNDEASILVVDDSEVGKNAFSIMHPFGDRWLTLLDGTLSWTDDRQQRTLFYGVMKMADSEDQVGELAEGEVALYQNGSYHGKTWVLSDYETVVKGDFLTLKGFAGLDNAISSIRLGPNTGVTLFANEDQRVDAGQEETQKQDYIENVPDMGAQDSQIGEDKVSSLKIFRIAQRETIFTAVTSKLSQDYRLVGDNDETLEEFSAYRTILRVLPEVTEVEVFATDLTTIEVEGTYHTISEDSGVKLSPNAMRQIMITSEADGLSTPGLKLHTNGMRENQFVVIFPDEEVHQQIAELEDGALWNATDVAGERIVDDQYSLQEVASVQSTIKRTMAAVVKPSNDPCVPVIDNPWTLNFQPLPIMNAVIDGGDGSNAPSVNIWEEPLEQNSFEQLFAQAEIATEPSTNVSGGSAIISPNSVFMKIGDAVKNAASITIGLSKITGLLNAIVKIGDKIVSFVLNTAKKVAEFVEEVVKRVVKSVKKFIEFLQFIFDWDDILHTRQYLVDSINTTFDYVQKLVESAKKPVSKFFDRIQEKVETGLNNLITDLGGDPADSGPEFEIPEALEWLLNKLLSGKSEPLDFVPEDIKPDVIKDLTEEDFFATLSERIDESKSGALIELFEGFIESIMSFVTNPRKPGLALVQIVEALKDIVFDILDALEDLALDFLDFVVDAIEKLQNLLNFKFDIPFISRLFELLKLDKLSPLNLTCLFVAIPATVISKLNTGKKPFDGIAPLDFSKPPQVSQLAFASSTSPIGQRAATDTATNTEVDDALLNLVIAWSNIGMGGDIVGGATAAILDFIPEGADDLTGPFTSFLEGINLTAAVISWFGSFPFAPSIEPDEETENLPQMPGGFPYDIAAYIAEENKEAFDKNMILEYTMWSWRTGMLALDVVFFVGQGKILAKMGESKIAMQRLRRSVKSLIIVSMGLSAVDLALTSAFVATIPTKDKEGNEDKEAKKDKEATVYAEILGVMPGLFPWMRLIPLPYGLVASGLLSGMDIIAMVASLDAFKRDISKLRALKNPA